MICLHVFIASSVETVEDMKWHNIIWVSLILGTRVHEGYSTLCVYLLSAGAITQF